MIGMKSINKMKIDKYITKTVGYIRFNNIIEFNYSIYEWALPFSFNKEEALFEFRILCLSIIKIKK